jgi:hypothetical protein
LSSHRSVSSLLHPGTANCGPTAGTGLGFASRCLCTCRRADRCNGSCVAADAVAHEASMRPNTNKKRIESLQIIFSVARGTARERPGLYGSIPSDCPPNLQIVIAGRIVVGDRRPRACIGSPRDDEVTQRHDRPMMSHGAMPCVRTMYGSRACTGGRRHQKANSQERTHRSLLQLLTFWR